MKKDIFSLNGKTAVVTGSSTGMGQAFCTALAGAGADVVGVDYVESKETAKLVEGSGGSFLELVADLSDIKVIPSVIERVNARFGKIDILINNAGIIRREDCALFSEKDWDDVINLNLKTVFFFSQAVAKQFMAGGRGGKIINIASMLSYQGGIRVPSYTAAKSGVKGITMTMANEWAKHNINVNCIAPGYIRTNNTKNLLADKERSDAILARIPAGRWGDPDDVAGAAVFLASTASDYIHGYCLAVDGGWLAR